MTDMEKLDIALCNIVTNSNTCEKCTLRHYINDEYVAYCFFAYECIPYYHKYYKEKENEANES